MKRKLDFVAEVYALLERLDPVNAKIVLKELVEMLPWTKGTFVGKLERESVGYEEVDRASARIIRICY